MVEILYHSSLISMPQGKKRLKLYDAELHISEYSAFSLDVYRDPDRPPLPEGWQILCDCPVEFQKNGYFGSAYYIYDEENDWYYIAIAHRGTNNIHDLYEDVVYLMEKKEPPLQFYSGAIPFIQYVIQTIMSVLPEGSYIPELGFTGHSLGATLAEMSLAYVLTNMPNPFIGKPYQIIWGLAVTFESPGSYEILQKMIANGQIAQEDFADSQEYTMIFNADVNAINSCMSHGDVDVSYCEIPYSYIPLYDGTYPVQPNILYFLYNFTVKDQHSMLKMYHHWNAKNMPAEIMAIENKRLSSNYTWPSTPEEGYQFYNSYGVPDVGSEVGHQGYWEGYSNKNPGYIQRVWNSHPEIQPLYRNYYDFHQQYRTLLIDNSKKFINVLSSNSVKDRTLPGLFKRGMEELERNQKELENKLDEKNHLTALERAQLKDLYKLANVSTFFTAKNNDSHRTVSMKHSQQLLLSNPSSY